MTQKAAIANQAAESPKKCFHRRFRKFIDTKRTKLCVSDLSLPLAGDLNDSQRHDKSGEFGSVRVRLVLLSAAALAVLFALVLFYARQDPQATAKLSRDGAAQPASSQGEQPEDSAPTARQSDAAEKRILAALKGFQDATETSISYDEYDERLTRLKDDLNDTLPTFVGDSLSDVAFRQDVAAALNDYTAAGNWWKTCIRNSNVLNDADRVERLQANWNSAETHINNAEKLLYR